MRWKGGRQSDNLQDRRRLPSKRVAGAGAGGLVIIVMLVGVLFGVDPQDLQQLLNAGGGAQQQVEPGPETAADVESREFAATILGFTEDVWEEQFRRSGQRYRPPEMVLFSEEVDTGCGTAPSAVGPFYCPADETVYLDPTFFAELEQTLGGSSAEFSQAYVIAHEVGHHIQHLLGYTDEVRRRQRGVSKAQANQESVRLELQADYLAGVWAHYGQAKFRFIETGDIDAAISSARAIGDDRLQRRSRGFTSPESYTHGTSQQRIRWFRDGLETGDLSKLRLILDMPYSEL